MNQPEPTAKAESPLVNKLLWENAALVADRKALIASLRDLLGFCQRRIATGHIPPQGQRAMDLLRELGELQPND